MHITANIPAATVINKGFCQLSKKERAIVGEFNARKEPSLATVRFIPKANDSSFPLNQRATIVVIATIMDSAPSPNISLPDAIVTRSPFIAVTTAPIIIRIVKIKTDFLVPILSIINPPINTIIIFGKLYIAFSSPMFESEKPSCSFKRSARGLILS